MFESGSAYPNNSNTGHKNLYAYFIRTICSHFVSSLLSSTKFANEPLINWRDSIRRFTGGGEKHI